MLRVIIFISLALAAHAGAHDKSQQLCNKAAAMAILKGSQAEGGLAGDAGGEVAIKEAKAGGSSQACTGCLMIEQMKAMKEAHGGHRRLLAAHETTKLPAEIMSCFGFGGEAAKTKATCLNAAADEAAAGACMAGFDDAATVVMTGTKPCNALDTLQSVAELMEDEGHDGHRRRGAHMKGEAGKGKKMSSAMYACAGCMADNSPNRRRREGHEAAMKCMPEKLQKCSTELSAMEGEDEKAASPVGRRLLAGHEAMMAAQGDMMACIQKAGTDTAAQAKCGESAMGGAMGDVMGNAKKIQDCMAKAGTDPNKLAECSGMGGAAGDMMAGVMGAMGGLGHGHGHGSGDGHGSGGMADMMKMLESMMGGDATAAKAMEAEMEKMMKQVTTQMESMEGQLKEQMAKKAPSCNTEDLHDLIEKEMHKQMEGMDMSAMEGQLKAAGLPDAQAKEMMEAMVKQASRPEPEAEPEAESEPESEPENAPAGVGTAAKGVSSIAPTVGAATPPASTTISGSGVTVLSLGAALVALVGLVAQI